MDAVIPKPVGGMGLTNEVGHLLRRCQFFAHTDVAN